MTSALIGHSGFVGSNIADQLDVDDRYNTSNIGDIRGKRYELVVSAANGAEMWRINADPEPDRCSIDQFKAHLAEVEIQHLVLISTVAVYARTIDVDESTLMSTDGLTPYGVHRLELEQWCAEHFPTTVIRLPGLFGPGLKKNVIFDLLHENNVEKIHADSAYQYYDLSRIGRDIQASIAIGTRAVNLAVPPVTAAEVAKECFGIDFDQRPADTVPARWDMRTRYAEAFGSTGTYIMSREEEMERLSRFVSEERAR